MPRKKKQQEPPVGLEVAQSAVIGAAAPLFALFRGREAGTHLTDSQKEALKRLIAMGVPYREIKIQTGVGLGTLVQLAQDNAGEISKQREVFKATMVPAMHDLALSMTGRLQEVVMEGSMKDVKDGAIGLGVLIDKSAILSGEATATINLVNKIDQESLNTALERIKAIQGMRSAEEIMEADYVIKDGD